MCARLPSAEECDYYKIEDKTVSLFLPAEIDDEHERFIQYLMPVYKTNLLLRLPELVIKHVRETEEFISQQMAMYHSNEA